MKSITMKKPLALAMAVLMMFCIVLTPVFESNTVSAASAEYTQLVGKINGKEYVLIYGYTVLPDNTIRLDTARDEVHIPIYNNVGLWKRRTGTRVESVNVWLKSKNGLNSRNGIALIENHSSARNSVYTYYYIPESINGRKVTVIGPNLFNNSACLFNISIPRYVERIQWGAFANCPSLESVYFRNGTDNLKGIDDFAFAHCEDLGYIGVEDDDIFAPKKLERVGEYAFWGTNLWMPVALPESMGGDIGTNAFNNIGISQGTHESLDLRCSDVTWNAIMSKSELQTRNFKRTIYGR